MAKLIPQYYFKTWALLTYRLMQTSFLLDTYLWKWMCHSWLSGLSTLFGRYVCDIRLRYCYIISLPLPMFSLFWVENHKPKPSVCGKVGFNSFFDNMFRGIMRLLSKKTTGKFMNSRWFFYFLTISWLLVLERHN